MRLSSRITAIAETSVSSGMTPIARPPPSAIEAVSIAPSRSRRLSAEKASSSPFWMMIDRPKVTSSGGSRSRPKVRLSSTCCSAKPTTNITGIATRAARNGSRPSHVASDEDREGGQHDQVAVGEIDQPHDAEDQRQAGREQRIEAAEQNALDDACRASRSCSTSEIGAVNLFARQFRWPARERHPALLEAIDAIGDLHRLHDVLLDQHDAGAVLP